MDAIENIISRPISVVHAEFEKTETMNIPKTMDFFRNKFKGDTEVFKIPSLNNVPSHYLAPNSLVRFRAMVQDMHDPEYCMGVYETVNTKTNERKIKLGLFKELSDCGADEDIVFDSPKAVTIERQNLYCVPIPGETTWVKEGYSEISTFALPGASIQASTLKRQRSGGNDMETDVTEMEDGSIKLNVEGSKRHRTVTNSSVHSTSPTDDLPSSDFNFNFPLPGEEGTPCIVTIYENQEKFRLNEMYEYIGVLSVDPALAKQTMSNQKPEDEQVVVWPDTMSAEEKFVHCPPPSLVPRLHCIMARKLKYHCPLLSTPTKDESGESPQTPSNIASIRAELIQILTRLLYGDDVAAEYLLLNIISRVYGRADVLALGKFSLNLSNCRIGKDPDHSIANDLHEFIDAIVAKNHYLPLSVKDLNSMSVVPKKDYQSNRLISGILQVAHGTHFILDETVMEPGQLDTQGVKNITAIGNMIQWQKVDYDFSFQQCEILTDIPIIVVSEGRSLFQCDCQLPLNKKDSSSPSATSLLSHIPKSLLNQIRIYIEFVRNLNYDLTPDIQEKLKEDFIHSREVDSKSMDADIFQLLLVTARLYSLSYGKQELSTAFWNKTKALDAERRQRIANMPSS